MATVKWSIMRFIYRKVGEVCYIVTVRRCSMLLDDDVMSELNSVK